MCVETQACTCIFLPPEQAAESCRHVPGRQRDPRLLTLQMEPKNARPWDERRKCNLGFDIMKVSLL